MRVKLKTIKLAEVRRLIRSAINWYKVDNGMLKSWTSEDYIKARLCKRKYHYDCKSDKCFYYARSSKAIEDIAKKIYEVIKK